MQELDDDTDVEQPDELMDAAFTETTEISQAGDESAGNTSITSDSATATTTSVSAVETESSASRQASGNRVVRNVRKARIQCSAEQDAATGALKEITKAISASRNENRPPEPTEDDHFGRSVAKTLERFDEHKKAMAKLRIQQVLFDVEFGRYGQFEETPTTTLPSDQLSSEFSWVNVNMYHEL